MKKNKFLKILLFISLTILIWLIYSKFFKTNKVVEINNNGSDEEIIYNSNIIKDINYSSKDLKGNEYILIAKEGEIDLNNTDIIFLNDVTAYIKLKKNQN
jgi:hypothetical protein